MKKILLIGSALTLFVMSGCGARTVPSGNTMVLNGHAITVTRAETAEQQTKGLAGVTGLSLDQGMLFVFQDRTPKEFWMKGMLIPIDIVWLDGDMITGIERAVSPPDAANPVPDEELPRYPSPGPVTRVLEVTAGFADVYGLKSGDTVRYR